MIAVAIGGEMLASIFRCLFYDYRHYSGGLPDLLLVRAQYDDGSLLGGADLGEWVGECFSPDVVEEGKINEVINRLIDRDDEFLGCSKNSDFQQNSRGKRKRGGKLSNYELNTDMIGENVEESPRELELNFNGRNVCAQSIFVEVKSANDRLDSRQEDWLNILDKDGNARVCKFVKQSQK